MTNEEALQFFKDDMPLRVSGYELKCDAYEAAIEALEKQIPKKPFKGNDCVTAGKKIFPDYRCPACGKQVYFYESLCKRQYLFTACQCGQRIGWSDEE